MLKIDKTRLNGAQKTWLYNHCVIARLAWPFMVYDFSVTSTVAIANVCTAYLKRWLGFTKTSVPEILYMSKKRFGLGLKDVRVFFKQMQVVRVSLLRDSLDPRMVELYAHIAQRDSNRERWKATRCFEKAKRDIVIDGMSARGQSTRHGIGYLPYTPPPEPGTHAARREVSLRIAADADAIRHVHLMGLAMQGECTAWDTLIAQDLSWHRLMYDLSPAQLGFAMKSLVNMLPTPDNLHRWRYGDFPCKLCGAPTPTPAHIQSSCKTALQQGRYKYRHDQVLAVLYAAVARKASSVSKAQVRTSSDDEVRFHAAGTRAPAPQRKSASTILDTACDWVLTCDLASLGPYTFPLPGVTTLLPDLVLVSDATKQIVIVELTCPNEACMEDARERKRAKYSDKLVPACEATHKTTLLTIEVGNRGFLSVSTQRALQRLGVWSGELHRQLSNTVLRASYAIFINRNDPVWSWNVDLHGTRQPSRLQ
jgi:hypothetical protein